MVCSILSKNKSCILSNFETCIFWKHKVNVRKWKRKIVDSDEDNGSPWSHLGHDQGVVVEPVGRLAHKKVVKVQLFSKSCASIVWAGSSTSGQKMSVRKVSCPWPRGFLPRETALISSNLHTRVEDRRWCPIYIPVLRITRPKCSLRQQDTLGYRISPATVRRKINPNEFLKAYFDPDESPRQVRHEFPCLDFRNHSWSERQNRSETKLECLKLQVFDFWNVARCTMMNLKNLQVWFSDGHSRSAGCNSATEHCHDHVGDCRGIKNRTCVG